MKKRADVNQVPVAEALRADGWAVAYTFELGRGFPDLVVGKSGLTILIEVKSHLKSDLTPAEERFHTEWIGGPLLVVTTPDEAVRRCSLVLNEWRVKCRK